MQERRGAAAARRCRCGAAGGPRARAHFPAGCAGPGAENGAPDGTPLPTPGAGLLLSRQRARLPLPWRRCVPSRPGAPTVPQVIFSINCRIDAQSEQYRLPCCQLTSGAVQGRAPSLPAPEIPAGHCPAPPPRGWAPCAPPLPPKLWGQGTQAVMAPPQLGRLLGMLKPSGGSVFEHAEAVTQQYWTVSPPPLAWHRRSAARGQRQHRAMSLCPCL